MRKLIFILIITTSLFSQVEDKWTMISKSGNGTTYIDTTDLDSYKGDDVYVWVMEKYNSPITVESVGEPIYITKTYYLFNKKLQRYSLVQIIYYNEKNNVLKSYNYNRNTDVESYKYNFPVLRGSNEEIILENLYELTGAPEKE